MTSPFEDIDRAFEPMFTECIEADVTKSGKLHRYKLEVQVYQDLTDDVDDNMMDTDILNILIVTKAVDLPVVKCLKRGDVIIRCIPTGLKKYKVTSCEYDYNIGYIIRAKSI